MSLGGEGAVSRVQPMVIPAWFRRRFENKKVPPEEVSVKEEPGRPNRPRINHLCQVPKAFHRSRVLFLQQVRNLAVRSVDRELYTPLCYSEPRSRFLR